MLFLSFLPALSLLYVVVQLYLLALMLEAVAFFSDSANIFRNSSLLLLLLGCSSGNDYCSVIIAYFEKMDIIIDSINVVGKHIIFAFGIISKLPINIQRASPMVSRFWLSWRKRPSVSLFCVSIQMLNY
jgi:hypothetical protein